MFAATVSAAIVDGRRQAPRWGDDPQQTELTCDGETEQYLYNKGAQAFALGANDWNTRASMSQTKGYKWRIESVDGGTFRLTDYVETKSAWLSMFADNAEGIWVDNNNGANVDKWTINRSEEDPSLFLIANPSAATGVLGGPWNVVAPRLNLVDPAADPNNHVLWYAVTEEEYNHIISLRNEGAVKALQDQFTVYEAAEALYAKIEEAEGIDIDVSSEKAIYLNEDATIDQINGALEELQAKINKKGSEGASVDKPFDMTSNLVNPNFEGSVSGWSGTGMAYGNNAGEHFNKTYDTYQTVSGIPAGVYGLKTQAYYRAGDAGPAWTNFNANAENNAMVYATDVTAEKDGESFTSPIMSAYEGILPNNSLGGSELKATDEDGNDFFIPNNMATGQTYFTAGYYKDNTVVFAVTEGTAQVGVKKEKTVTNDWSMFNAFQLEYYGNGADAYQYLMDNFLSSIPDYSAAVATDGDKDDFLLVIQTSDKAATYEEFLLNRARIQAAEVFLKANIDAWAELDAEVATAKKVAGSGDYAGPDVQDLADELDEYAKRIKKGRTMTTDEVIEYTAKIKAMKEAAVQNSIMPGADFTDMIVNPNFAQGETGWTFEKSGGNVRASASDKMAEGWKSTFDIYQEITGVPVGCYEISVQAFYREGRDESSWLKYFDPDTKERRADAPESKAYIYMNNVKNHIPDVYTFAAVEGFYSGATYKSPDNYYYPNDMKAAGEAFALKKYPASAFGLIAKKGDVMRIGLKGDYPDADNWGAFTDFKLTYQGFQADIIQPQLEAVMEQMIIDEPMGYDTQEELIVAHANAELAIDSQDGKEMFNALAACYAVLDKVETSIALYQAVESKITELDDAIADTQASQETIDEAEALLDELNNSYYDMTDAQLAEAIEKVDAMIKKLAIPGDIDDASDENPIELTMLITNPSFETGDLTGWTKNDKATGDTGVKDNSNGTYTITNADGMYVFNTWNSGAVEGNFFVSQTLKDFPRTGTYAVMAIGASDAENVIALSATQEEAADTAKIAIVGDKGTAEEIECFFKVEDLDAEVEISMSSATWFKADMFQLFYFGTDSKHEPSATEAAVEETAAVVKKEVINIGGMMTGALKQGVNIIRVTKADGSVEVRKVTVR